MASGLDFLGGMTAAEVPLAGGASEPLFGEGGADFTAAAGELADFGAGDAVFSVVTDTLGSEDEGSAFSGGVISGEADGLGLDSSTWARANGAEAIRRAVKARMVLFIFCLLVDYDYPGAFSSQAGQIAASGPLRVSWNKVDPILARSPVKTVINRRERPSHAMAFALLLSA